MDYSNFYKLMNLVSTMPEPPPPSDSTIRVGSSISPTFLPHSIWLQQPLFSCFDHSSREVIYLVGVMGRGMLIAFVTNLQIEGPRIQGYILSKPTSYLLNLHSSRTTLSGYHPLSPYTNWHILPKMKTNYSWVKWYKAEARGLPRIQGQYGYIGDSMPGLLRPCHRPNQTRALWRPNPTPKQKHT